MPKSDGAMGRPYTSVWILTHSIPYEGLSILGVFATEQEADNAKELLNRYQESNLNIAEWPVNDKTDPATRVVNAQD